MNRKQILLILLIFISCKKTYKDYFQGSLAPVVLFESPNLISRKVVVLEHNEKVSVLLDPKTQQPKLFRDKEGTTAFVSVQITETQRGYVSAQKISERKTQFFFRVVSTDGLNLRREPNASSKILTVIPHQFVGEIKTQVGQYVQIQGRYGYWLNVSYGTQSGYIFSGFVKISSNKADLTDSFLDYEFAELPEVDLVTVGQFGKLSQKATHQNYEIFELNYNSDPTDCFAKKSATVFKNTITNKAYISNQFYSERIEGPDKLIPNAYNTSYEICLCCCPGWGDNTFFLSREKIHVIHTKFQPSKMKCMNDQFDGPMYGFYRELRKDDLGNIFVHLRVPDCLETGNEKFQNRELKTLENPTKVIASAFIKISNDPTGFSGQIYKKSEIPAEYQEAWRKAKLIE